MAAPRIIPALITPILIVACAAMVPAVAQVRGGAPGAARRPAAPAESPAAQPVPPTPQQTTASFGDWTVRCSRAQPGAPVCEAVQSVSNGGRTVAEMAFGRIARDQPLRMTILVPPSVSFGSAPVLAPAQDKDPPVLEMAWRRCLPGGCLADAVVPDDVLRRVRTDGEAARVVFPDAAGRPVALPFSARGLPQALDALAKEEAG